MWPTREKWQATAITPALASIGFGHPLTRDSASGSMRMSQAQHPTGVGDITSVLLERVFGCDDVKTWRQKYMARSRQGSLRGYPKGDRADSAEESASGPTAKKRGATGGLLGQDVSELS